MKHLDEYRDKDLVNTLIRKIRDRVSRSWNIMEICGGQTHSIMRYGLLDLLPEEIRMIHGPGCPVCVTPISLIDKAIALALRKEVTLSSFGDMLRVPGTREDLLSAKARGADVRMVYSPLDALALAEQMPNRQVVFFAVGFETTSPAVALTLSRARSKGISNFSVLVAHVLVPPAMRALLSSPDQQIDAFLAAGHVCTIMGYEEYIPISKEHHIPIVVTGFEPVDLLLGIHMSLEMLENGETGVKNAYPRVVRKEGNVHARKSLETVFEPCDRHWRGIGTIPDSGFRLKPAYRSFDAEQRFSLEDLHSEESEICIAGDVLTGKKTPKDCPAFGTMCKPERPLGAPMVSSEGACAAYLKYSL